MNQGWPQEHLSSSGERWGGATSAGDDDYHSDVDDDNGDGSDEDGDGGDDDGDGEQVSRDEEHQALLHPTVVSQTVR